MTAVINDVFVGKHRPPPSDNGHLHEGCLLLAQLERDSFKS